MKWDFFQKHGDSIVVCISFLIILVFILNYIPLGLLLSKTTTTGGDTAAHYYPAWYMKSYLLPHFKITGWSQGWYAGIPMFQFYFPFTFVLISTFSTVFSLEVAFKLMTFLAIIGIPIGAYVLFRLLKFSKELAAIAAIFTVPHLFMEAQSMWGANIPSTFAGEFSYAFGIVLSLVYLGLMYEGINSGKHLLKNAILLGVIGVTHAYTLLWVVPSTLFLLIGPDFKKRLWYWFQVNAIAFLLLASWALRWVYYSHYTTAYADKWAIGNWKEVFPRIFWPFSVLALVGIVYAVFQKEKRVFYLLFAAAIGTIYYFSAYYIGGVDIRFIPFIQLMLLLVAAYSVSILWRFKLRALRFVPIVALLLTLLWVQPQVKFIDDWAQWNYEGFEGKKVWPQYSAVQEFIKGNENDPRVVYENHDRNNAAGTTRAFELLPYFSGRSTLEGLYMQSNPTSPFVFYIQSEISKQASCPFPDKKCTNFNLDKGLEHLKVFNVKHFVTVTDDVKSALANHTGAKLVFEKSPYAVFELLANDSGYVVVPKYKPLYFPRDNWKNRSYELFPNDYDVPVIFDESVKEEPPVARELLNKECTVTSEVRQEEILFNTTCVGAPHIVRVSYFPRWKSGNGEKIHLVSPSFMLIYPEKEQTRLYFGRTWVENVTLLLSLIGWAIVLAYRHLSRRWEKLPEPSFFTRFREGFLALAKKIYISSSRTVKKFKKPGFVPIVILFLLIVSYITIFGVMTVDRHNRFYTTAYDLGMHDQQIWHHSRFLTPFNTIRGMNPLGDHFFLINAFISPLYWFFDDIRALLVLQVVALAAAAIPLFFIAKRYFKNSWIPLVICFSYLIFPALHWGNFEDYHTEAFVPLFLLLAFYFIITGKKWSYLVFFFLALTVKEDISLNTFLLGIYIYFKHDKKLGIFTSVFSLLWFLLTVKVFMPFFSSAGYLHTWQVVGHFGDSPLDVFLGLLKPKLLFSTLFNATNAKYIWELFSPVAFLAFLNPLTLIISASLWINLIASWDYAHSIHYHYVLTVIPFIFISVVIGIARFKKWRIVMFSLLSILFVSSVMGNYYLSPHDVSIRNYEHIKEKFKNFLIPSANEAQIYHMIGLIPEYASVSVAYDLAPHLTHRNKIYMFPNPFQRSYFGTDNIPYPPIEYVDYLLLRKDHIAQYNATLLPLMENGTYQFVDESANIELFERKK